MEPPKVTGGDLYHLWRISDVHLPRIADAFYDATRILAAGRRTGTETDADAFRADTQVAPVAGGMASSIAWAWGELRDEVQQGFAQVGETILEAAIGVRQATEIYLNADAANADLLKVYLADPRNHDPNNPDSNPPVPGSEQDPGRPAPIS